MKFLITGGCGFLGSNIASAILGTDAGELVVFDNLSRAGSIENLSWLRSLGKLQWINGDIRNRDDVDRTIAAVKPDFVFHLAGQVAMTTSIENPRLDFETNTVGTFNLIDAVRRLHPRAAILYSSTNKVYGDLEWVQYEETTKRYVAVEYPNGFPESIPLNFQSPYGCTKGAADQLMLDAHRIFGIRTVVFRHSSMFGGRQFSTTDQGWVGWFCLKALEQAQGQSDTFTISGNGKQVRDILFSDDMARLYLLAATSIDRIQGQVFNVGGGMSNSLSLIELFDLLESRLNVNLRYQRLPARISDQKVFVADITRLWHELKWKPTIGREDGIDRMIAWVKRSAGV